MLKKYLYIFLISMVPLIELRGAIPVSQGFQLPLLQSYIAVSYTHLDMGGVLFCASSDERRYGKFTVVLAQTVNFI